MFSAVTQYIRLYDTLHLEGSVTSIVWGNRHLDALKEEESQEQKKVSTFQ